MKDAKSAVKHSAERPFGFTFEETILETYLAHVSIISNWLTEYLSTYSNMPLYRQLTFPIFLFLTFSSEQWRGVQYEGRVNEMSLFWITYSAQLHTVVEKSLFLPL